MSKDEIESMLKEVDNDGSGRDMSKLARISNFSA